MQPMQLSRRKIVAIMLVALLVIAVALLIAFARGKPVLKIGILHSLTGTMSISEKPLVDMLQFALEEVNDAGGINGRMLEAVTVDCRSDWRYCAEQAERLIAEEKVSVLFGCWASSCRKEVKTVVEKHNHLLFYPVPYEGIELSSNIIYTGAAPNQQIVPATRWALDHLGKRVFLVGSDYVYPRMANILVKDLLLASGADLAGERYLLLGSEAMHAVVADIGRQRPDVVINTLVGSSNVAFFAALAKAGISAYKIPVLSFRVAEVELAAMTNLNTTGHYAAGTYFQSLSSPQNLLFINQFKQRFGAQAVVDDTMEASYIGLKLWAQAAREAGSAEPARVQRTILRQTLLAPRGIVAVDAETRHLWYTPRIGKIRRDGQFDIVWDAGRTIGPVSYPSYRLQEDWEQLLKTAERKGR